MLFSYRVIKSFELWSFLYATAKRFNLVVSRTFRTDTCRLIFPPMLKGKFYFLFVLYFLNFHYNFLNIDFSECNIINLNDKNYFECRQDSEEGPAQINFEL